MIVTTGRIIKIRAGEFNFERNSETPGILVVTSRSHGEVGRTMSIPTNQQELEQFITALRRCAAEDVGYRKNEVENSR